MIIQKKDNVLISIDDINGVLLSVAKIINEDVNVIALISDDDAVFLRDELGIDMGNCRTISCDAETANNIITDCFNIESEEVLKSTDENFILSKRGEKAVYIINLLHGEYEHEAI